MAQWLEIYADVENVPKEQIGQVRHGLWTIVQWQLDQDKEPIIESSRVLDTNLKQSEAIEKAQRYASEIKEKTYVSGSGRFTIKPIWYELLGYDFIV